MSIVALKELTLESTMKVYVGVTGLAGTGKSTFADVLADLASARGIAIRRFNLSDEVRCELVRQGREDEVTSRKALIDTANELRAVYGPGVLAERTVVKDLEESFGNNQPNLVVITGIRSPAEVATFKNAWAEQFLLTAVVASEESRNARMSDRRQYDEDVDPLAAVELADQAIGIPDCIQMSNYRIPNDGSIEQLHRFVEAFLRHVITPMFEQQNTPKTAKASLTSGFSERDGRTKWS